MIGEKLFDRYCSSKGVNNSQRIFNIDSLNFDKLSDRILEKGKNKRSAAAAAAEKEEIKGKKQASDKEDKEKE